MTAFLIIIGIALLGGFGFVLSILKKVKKPLEDGLTAVSMYTDEWAESVKTDIALKKAEQEIETLKRLKRINDAREAHKLDPVELGKFD
jgi:hypothetical protein